VPKRSNDFQRLIKLIEQQLAPSGARVEESAMLPDLVDGEAVEIDTLISLAVGARTLRTAVECRDCSRKQTKPWIRELIGKYQHLAVDRVVAVSKLGFSAGAERVAAHAKIETRSLEQAAQLDWARELTDLTAFRVEDRTYEHLEDTRVVLRGRYDTPPGFSPELREIMVAIPTRDRATGFARIRMLSLRELVMRVTDEPRHDELVARAAGTTPNGIVKIWLQLPPGSLIYDSDNAGHPVSRSGRCAW
jgi:phosphate uptake regulator